MAGKQYEGDTFLIGKWYVLTDRAAAVAAIKSGQAALQFKPANTDLLIATFICVLNR